MRDERDRGFALGSWDEGVARGEGVMAEWPTVAEERRWNLEVGRYHRYTPRVCTDITSSHSYRPSRYLTQDLDVNIYTLGYVHWNYVFMYRPLV